MGKTFRREKTYGSKRRPKLNNHRQLPDYQDSDPELDGDYPFDDDQAEEYYGKELQTKDRDNKPTQDPASPKDD